MLTQQKKLKKRNSKSRNKTRLSSLKLKIARTASTSQSIGSSPLVEKKFIENPELTAIYNQKMWDIFKVILDKCMGDDEINFTIIDPPVRSITRHPLMLIARLLLSLYTILSFCPFYLYYMFLFMNLILQFQTFSNK